MRGLRVLAAAALLAAPLAAQNDPFYARVRGLTDRGFGSFQGADCVTVAAPREVVFRLLSAPDRAATFLLEGLDNVLPRGAKYGKEGHAAKGAVLTLTADTMEGSRQIEMTVVAVVPGRLVAFAVTKDDQVLARDVTDFSDTFYLESNPDGTTDVWWANHWDPSSPFAAALAPIRESKRYRARRELGLLALEGLARAAAEHPEALGAPDAPAKKR